MYLPIKFILDVVTSSLLVTKNSQSSEMASAVEEVFLKELKMNLEKMMTAARESYTLCLSSELQWDFLSPEEKGLSQGIPGMIKVIRYLESYGNLLFPHLFETSQAKGRLLIADATQFLLSSTVGVSAAAVSFIEKEDIKWQNETDIAVVEEVITSLPAAAVEISPILAEDLEAAHILMDLRHSVLKRTGEFLTEPSPTKKQKLLPRPLSPLAAMPFEPLSLSIREGDVEDSADEEEEVFFSSYSDSSKEESVEPMSIIPLPKVSAKDDNDSDSVSTSSFLSSSLASDSEEENEGPSTSLSTELSGNFLYLVQGSFYRTLKMTQVAKIDVHHLTVIPFIYIRPAFPLSKQTFIITCSLKISGNLQSFSTSIRQIQGKMRDSQRLVAQILTNKEAKFDWKEPLSGDYTIDIERGEALKIILRGFKETLDYFLERHPVFRNPSNKVTQEIKKIIHMIETEYQQTNYVSSRVFHDLETQVKSWLVQKSVAESIAKGTLKKVLGPYCVAVFTITCTRQCIPRLSYVPVTNGASYKLSSVVKLILIRTLAHAERFLEHLPKRIKYTAPNQKIAEEIQDSTRIWSIILEGLQETYLHLQEHVKEALGQFRKEHLGNKIERLIGLIKAQQQVPQEEKTTTPNIQAVLSVHEKSLIQSSTQVEDAEQIKSILLEPMLLLDCFKTVDAVMKRLSSLGSTTFRFYGSIIPFFGIYRRTNSFFYVFEYRSKIHRNAGEARMIADQQIRQSIYNLRVIRSRATFLEYREPFSLQKKVKIDLNDALQIILRGFRETLAYAEIEKGKKLGGSIKDSTQVCLRNCIKELEELLGNPSFSPTDTLERLVQAEIGATMTLAGSEPLSSVFTLIESKKKFSRIKTEEEKAKKGSLHPIKKKDRSGKIQSYYHMPIFQISIASRTLVPLYNLSYSSKLTLREGDILRRTAMICEKNHANVMNMRKEESQYRWHDPASQRPTSIAKSVNKEGGLKEMWQGLRETLHFFQTYYPFILKIRRLEKSNLELLEEAIAEIEKKMGSECPSFESRGLLEKLLYECDEELSDSDSETDI